uniref:Lipoprotein n=1 Tax=Caulobacter sp. (strain K31) TaxID=366602 RepID=B0T312_CAUSK
MRPRAALGLTASAAILSGCAALPSAAVCPAGQSAGREVQLFFGRNIGDRLGVSEADFQRFVDEELTPRFPDGLTVLDAAGQWRGASGVIGRELSKVVILVLPGRTGDEGELDAVRGAYRARFSQEAVLMTVQPTCLGF